MPQYTFTCVRCNATYPRIVSSWRDRDVQRCDRKVILGGLDPAWHRDPDGKLVLDEVSLVPHGTQRDLHARLEGVCDGVLARQEELEVQTAATPYAWKP